MPLKLRPFATGASSPNKNNSTKPVEIKAEPGSTTSVPPNHWEQLKKALDQEPSSSTTANNSSDSKSSSTPIQLVETDHLIHCPDCNKPILQSALSHHKVNCAEIKRRAAMKRSAEDSLDSPNKKSKSGTSNNGGLVIVLGGGSGGSPPTETTSLKSTPNSKELKKKASLILKNESSATSPSTSSSKLVMAGDASLGSSNSAQAQAAAAAAAKAKASRAGPVDVDKQCGVINDKGLPCSRSLTCKSHSMGAKRSVPHRSQPYDILLHEWQKQNKPGFKSDRPVQPRVGPGSEGNDAGAYASGEAMASGSGAGGGASPSDLNAIASGSGSNQVIKKKKKKGTGAGGEETRKEKKSSRNHQGHGQTGHDPSNGSSSRGDGSSKKGGIQMVGEYIDDSDAGEQLAAAMGGNHDEAVLIDSDEEVEGVFRALGRIGRGRPLTMVGGGGAGFSAASMFVGRNSKLAKLGDVLGGVFSFTPPT